MNFAIDFYLLLCFNGLLYGCKLNLSMSSVYKRNCSSFSPLSYIFQKAVCEEFANCFLSFIRFYVLLPRIALTKVTRLWYNIERVYYIFVAKAFFLRYDGDTDKEEIYG